MKTLISLIAMILLMSGHVMAQPQAPIQWGERRWFGIGHVGYPWNVMLMGDTLAFAADSAYQGHTSIVCTTRDNGLTFTPWQRLDIGPRERVDAYLCGSAGRMFAYCSKDDPDGQHLTGWTMRSLDGGTSWSTVRPQTQGVYPVAGFASGRQAICIQGRELPGRSDMIEAVVSDNGGDTWSAPNILPRDSLMYYIRPMTATRSRLMVLGRDFRNVWPPRIAASMSDRSGQTWSPFAWIIREQTDVFYTINIAGDTASETAIVSTLRLSNSSPGADLCVIRTVDGGLNWEEPRALTCDGLLYRDDDAPQVFCRGKLWGIVWENFWDADTARWGVYMSLSANHGRDWYPPSPLGWDMGDMYYSGGQFMGDEVRVVWNSPSSRDYGTETGVLSRDTTAPTIDAGLALPAEIVADATVHFLASVWDNDSLAHLDVVLKRSGATDSNAVSLGERLSTVDYRGTWHVPEDTALWHYYYRAEDMWENVTVYPDTGMFSFRVTGLSASPSTFVPTSFSLSAFPNPFNPTTTISFSLPRAGEVSVKVFDVTGRLARVLVDGRREAGEHAMVLDGSGMASGIYFVRMESAGMERTEKIVLMK